MKVLRMAWRISVLSAFFCLAAGSSSAVAAEDSAQRSTIAFRLAEWKSLHFDDAELAKKHLAAVKQIGCEARQQNHNGHIDVTYRCPLWKPLVVGSEELVHQWETWLHQSGFETLHGHKAAGASHSHASGQHAHREVVAYRLAGRVTKHFDDEDEAKQFATILLALGCDVSQGRHGDHTDVSCHCAQWMHANFPSHDAAHAWEKWLQEIGFETRHHH